MTYGDVIILKSLGENLHDSFFVLSLNDTGGGSEDAVCSFPQAGVGVLAGLEEHGEKFRPLLTYISKVESSGNQCSSWS